MTPSGPAGPDPGAGVVVIGGGAVGSFIAALVARSGRAVVLVAHRPALVALADEVVTVCEGPT